MGDMSREPSMEDILSSIRRVIARDEAPGSVRELRVPEADDILDLQDEEDRAEAADGELVSEASADAARNSADGQSVAEGTGVDAGGRRVLKVAGRTMEDVALDALRPMLKDWLDTNLPSLVEAMVAKEISRITGKRL